MYAHAVNLYTKTYIDIDTFTGKLRPKSVVELAWYKRRSVVSGKNKK